MNIRANDEDQIWIKQLDQGPLPKLTFAGGCGTLWPIAIHSPGTWARPPGELSSIPAVTCRFRTGGRVVEGARLESGGWND